MTPRSGKKPTFVPSHLKVIVGLGNPGLLYARTYHNVGARAIDYLTSKDTDAGHAPRSAPFRYHIEHGIVFAHTTTYMNESGSAVRALLAYFNCSPAKLAVIHDDSDLTLGTFKVDFERGAAGHHGVASIIRALGDRKDFWRIRIGIRASVEHRVAAGVSTTVARRAKASEFVLRRISPHDKKILEGVFEKLDRLLTG